MEEKVDKIDLKEVRNMVNAYNDYFTKVKPKLDKFEDTEDVNKLKQMVDILNKFAEKHNIGISFLKNTPTDNDLSYDKIRRVEYMLIWQR